MKFWEKNWGKIALGLTLAVMVAVNFRWEYFILGNDNYSPEENPKVSFERYWQSPTWREYRGLGVPSDAEQVDIFRSGLFLVLEKIGVPLWLVSQGSVWVLFILGPMGMGWLAKRFFKKEEAFLAGGIIYLSSLLTLWLFFSPLKPFVFFWAFLPLFLAISDEVAERGGWKNWLGWVLVAIGLSTAFMIPTLFFVEVMVMGGMGIAMGRKKLAIIFLVFIVGQLWWLIPFGSYVKNQSGQLQDSFINRAITSGTIQDEKQFNTLGNVVRNITSWVNIANDDGEKLFKYGQLYQGSFGWLGYLSIALAMSGLVAGVKKREGSVWVLGVLMIAGIWLVKGANPPVGGWYAWVGEKVPLFSQVFRWGSSKFWPVVWLPMVLLAVWGWMRTKYLKWVVLGLWLIYVFPIFKGQLINNRDFVKIPGEYYQLRDYLARVDTKGRVYLAPEANMLYFKNHDWGFFGSVFWSYWIPNPVIEKALVTGSAENEEAFRKIVNLYYADDPRLLARILSNYGVKWVIGDKSLTNKGNGYKYNWESYGIAVEQNPYLEKVWERGKLQLYRVVGDGELTVADGGQPWTYELGEAKMFSDGVTKTDQRWRIENKSLVSGVYWDISDPELSGKLVKISARVKNESGIVAEINFRETKKEYQTAAYLGKYLSEEKMEEYFYLPKDWRNYLLEVIVKARGPELSVNEISDLKMEVMPLTADYLKARMPENQGWKMGKAVTYAGWMANACLVTVVLVLQALKRPKTKVSGSKKTTRA